MMVTSARDHNGGLALRRTPRAHWIVPTVFIALFLGGPALAQEPTRVQIRIKDHRFSPSEIRVPAGTPILLTITNADSTPEEFDSSALKVEKVIAGGTSGTVRLRPLGVGRYRFMGEYHAGSAQGVVVAQ